MKELRDGHEFFDGELVEIYEGRFAGPFIMDEISGASMSNGDLVTFIITARVDTPKFTYVKKTGDLKRSNVMKVQAVTPVDSDKARFLYDSLGENVSGINDGIIETTTGVVESDDVQPELINDDWEQS